MKLSKRTVTSFICIACCCVLLCACAPQELQDQATPTPAPSGTAAVNDQNTQGVDQAPDFGACATQEPKEEDFICGLPDNPGSNPSARPTQAVTPMPTVNPSPTVQSSKEPSLPTAIRAGDAYRIFLWSNTEENDVVYRDDRELWRWEDFQNKYGATVTWISNSYLQWQTEVFEAALAGEPVADIYCFGTTALMMDMLFYNASNKSVSPKDIYQDLSKYGEYTNFDDAKYWDQSAAEVGYFGGAQLAVVPYRNGWNDVKGNQVTFFNKKLLEEAGYSAQQMYSLYQSGQWTFDKFREIALACTNADSGVFGSAIGESAISMLSLISANGGRILTPDKDGIQRYTVNSEQSVYAINFLLDMCNKDKSIYLENTIKQREGDLFRNGKIALMLTHAGTVQENQGPMGERIYQTEGLEYGIVLPPKGPNAQDHISDRNDFSAYAVFKGHENIAGVVQCLYYYRTAMYPVDSQAQATELANEAYAYFTSPEDIQTLQDAVKKTRVSSYMPYWYGGSNTVNLSSNVAGYLPIWLDGFGNVQQDTDRAVNDTNFFIDRMLDRL